MAKFKSIPLSEIIVPTRLRAVEEDHAIALSLSIAEHGLLNPITVYPSNASKDGNYTLIAGAHRLRVYEILELPVIDALVFEGAATDAQILEITENLHRNELSVIDRAMFVQTYRELWEKKHGVINSQGGRPKNEDKLSPLFEGSFSEAVAMRLGLHPKAIKRLDQISRHLHPDMRAALRGTDLADNQSALLKLAKLEPEKQRQAAIAFKQEPDIKRAFALIDDSPKPVRADVQAGHFSTLIDVWSRADAQTKQKFLDHIGAQLPMTLEDAA